MGTVRSVPLFFVGLLRSGPNRDLEGQAASIVIWRSSKKRSFIVCWRVQQIPAVIVRVCRRRIRLKALGTERIANVSPENVISEGDV